MADDVLVRLLAERACERLVLDYARYVDTGEAGKVADLFTTDGVWIGADGRTMSGREEVRAAFTARQGLTRRLSRHVITNVLVTLRSDTEAVGVAYLVNYRHDRSGDTAEVPGPARLPKFVGDYHFSFLRVDGRWLVSSLRFDLIFLRPARERDGA
jgi:uncharacterized protein (TIGR02246 family)